MRTYIRPAARAQAQTSAPSVTASAPAAPSTTIAPDGRVAGIDGLLNQIAAAAINQARPMVVNDILPVIQADPAMQRNIGEGIGRGIGSEMSGPAWVAAGALGILAVVAVVHVARGRSRRSRSSSR